MLICGCHLELLENMISSYVFGQLEVTFLFSCIGSVWPQNPVEFTLNYLLFFRGAGRGTVRFFFWLEPLFICFKGATKFGYEAVLGFINSF